MPDAATVTWRGCRVGRLREYLSVCLPGCVVSSCVCLAVSLYLFMSWPFLGSVCTERALSEILHPSPYVWPGLSSRVYLVLTALWEEIRSAQVSRLGWTAVGGGLRGWGSVRAWGAEGGEQFFFLGIYKKSKNIFVICVWQSENKYIETYNWQKCIFIVVWQRESKCFGIYQTSKNAFPIFVCIKYAFVLNIFVIWIGYREDFF